MKSTRKLDNITSNSLQDLPLGSKLAGLTGLLVTILVLALTLLTIQRERANFRQELEGQANLLLQTLPLTMRDQLYLLEVDELADTARVVSQNEDVVLFIVYDRQGIILVDAAQLNRTIFSQVVDPLGEQLVRSDPEQVYMDWQAGQLVAGRAITLGNQRIGAIIIGLSTAPLDQKIADLTRQSTLLAFVILLLGGGLALLLARQITNPLGELAHVASQMAGGDLSTRAELRTRDEVGQLGEAFNQMATAIQKRETELRELAAGLERTVAARTAELRQQNEELVVARRQAEAANRAEREARQREINLARDIQEGLLPQADPSFPGMDIAGICLPAREVGGDMYGYYELPPMELNPQGGYAFAVGDVSGKGIPSALYMAVCTTMLTAKVPFVPDVAQLLDEMNAALYPYMSANRMNTALCYARLEPDAKGLYTLHIANAGLVAPILRRGKQCEYMNVSGLPLGVMPTNSAYHVLKLSLHEGDILVLSSDGVVEAMNASGEMYGFERLLDRVAQAPPGSARQVQEWLLAGVHAFTSQVEPHDDLTLIVAVAAPNTID